mmetsp:Transcript_3082/g.6184  ORF Transcript_3082/g.6184 Transcript_3082/m.6184 type:complete len:444 (-) Transcript_3082:1447-2778(-)
MMAKDFSYIGFVGCYTKPGQADPFEASHGGIPHDRSKVGVGVIAIGVSHNGELSFLGPDPIIKADDWPNPSYLTVLERDDQRPEGLKIGGLCVVSEQGYGKWQAFSLKRDNLSISATAVGEPISTGGSYPCHVTSARIPHEKLECILISNYGDEQGVFNLYIDGGSSYNEQSRINFGPGSRVDLTRQQSSHAHSSCALPPLDPSSSLLDICAADLGSDSIIQFSVTKCPNSGSFDCVEKGRLATPAGSGPRSLMFNPASSFFNIAIVSLEMVAQVALIRRRLHDGCLEMIGSPVSLLPENWQLEECDDNTIMQFNKGCWASDAVWSPDGKFVYAAARLNDSISVFQLQHKIDGYREDKSMDDASPSAVVIQGLKLVDRISTHGRTPRCITMSECGKFILVAHQHSHDVSSFLRDETSGGLTFVNQLDVNLAACVKLVRPEKIG